MVPIKNFSLPYFTERFRLWSIGCLSSKGLSQRLADTISPAPIMRLPRRVPWASVTELDQVCSWIYADEFDLDAKRLAMERVSTHCTFPSGLILANRNQLAGWRATTSLPHAIESTHAILSAILQDSAAQGSSSYLSLRQSYAAAIIRLVNGLVDPLQLGAYARSIGSIAAQLGLPAWLVELRHAATHEDLPSIELLRQAAHDVRCFSHIR